MYCVCDRAGCACLVCVTGLDVEVMYSLTMMTTKGGGVTRHQGAWSSYIRGRVTSYEGVESSVMRLY